MGEGNSNSMILTKRGSCLLAVVVLVFNLCLPLAYATEDEETTVTTRAALPSLGWRDTVAAWLMTSGIYPAMTEDDTSFRGWADNRVFSLWNEFVDFVGDSTQATLEDLYNVSSYLVDGVMMISKGKWGQLRNFTQFLRDKYALQDNQEGVQIGASADFPKIVSFSSTPTRNMLVSSGTVLPGNTSNRNFHYAFYQPVEGYTGLVASVRRDSNYNFYWVLIAPEYLNSSGNLNSNYRLYDIYTEGSYVNDTISTNYDVTQYQYNSTTVNVLLVGQHFPDRAMAAGIPTYSNADDLLSIWSKIAQGDNAFSGVIANTTIVNTPPALPAESDYGGIRIAGTGEAVTVEALQELIQEAVIEGLQPIINVVGVDLAPDISINPDNGDITQDPIEITPDNIPMTQSDYMIPQLHTRFPFSIPWDVFNVLNALNAEPQRPYWDVSLTLPGLLGEDIQIPFTIGVKDDSPVAAPMDRTAAVIRAFVLVLLCVGTLLVVIRR